MGPRRRRPWATACASEAHGRSVRRRVGRPARRLFPPQPRRRSIPGRRARSPRILRLPAVGAASNRVCWTVMDSSARRAGRTPSRSKERMFHGEGIELRRGVHRRSCRKWTTPSSRRRRNSPSATTSRTPAPEIALDKAEAGPSPCRRPSDFVARQVIDVIGSKLVKRGIDLAAVKWGDPQPAAGSERARRVGEHRRRHRQGHAPARINKDIKAHEAQGQGADRGRQAARELGVARHAAGGHRLPQGPGLRPAAAVRATTG